MTDINENLNVIEFRIFGFECWKCYGATWDTSQNQKSDNLILKSLNSVVQ